MSFPAATASSNLERAYASRSGASTMEEGGIIDPTLSAALWDGPPALEF